MRKKLDRWLTLTPKSGRVAGPSANVRPDYCLRLIATALTAAFLTINTNLANANMNLKLYAYNKMSWQQFECYNWLIHKESRWNPKARNGSHYGLAQMRSTWYRDLSPRRQVDEHIKYLAKRYDGCACKALHHLETKGWH